MTWLRLSRKDLFRGPHATRRLLLALGVIVAWVILLGATVGVWEYTNSSTFCGTTCHTMPPEYAAFKRSPHERVACVECHLGRSPAAVIFGRKAGDMVHVLRLLTGEYKVPIYASSMRPARESCERCHWPQKFSDDVVRILRDYAPDRNNTERDTYLMMHIGGGTRREGRGYGIHWHIEEQVWYIATDERKQNIPWVRVVDSNGRTKDYIDPTAKLSADFIEKAEKRRMDCIDCHNRVSHEFLNPDQAMDRLLTLKQVDISIPFIKKKGVEALRAPYSSQEEAMVGIAALDSFYRVQYPTFYTQNKEKVRQAVQAIQVMYRQIVFPTMDVRWGTHPDNLGHDRWPGCFRCHDGKHFAADGTSIRLSCNICHSIPRSVRKGEPVPSIAPIPPREPPSHLAANWMAEHRFVANSNCSPCHGKHTFGTDDSNFCSNSNCHGRSWKFVGLNAAFTHPVKLVGKHAKLTCNNCHEKATRPVNVCSNCHTAPHSFGKKGCEICHTPEGWKSSVAGLVAAAPQIPHDIEGLDDCLMCHGAQGTKPVPADHQGREVTSCRMCHRPAEGK